MIRIMIDGQPVPSAEASISVLDHGFLYGNSVYEVVKTRDGRLFAVKPHLRRLRYSASQVQIPIIPDDAFLLDELDRMVALVGTEEVYLRMVITRGIGDMGLNPDGCGEPRRIVYGKSFQPLPAELYRDGVRIIALKPEQGQHGNIKPSSTSRIYALSRRPSDAAVTRPCGSMNRAASPNVLRAISSGSRTARSSPRRSAPASSKV